MDRRVLALGALLFAACRAPVPVPPEAPAARAVTDGRVALENLDAQLVAATSALRVRADDRGGRALLVTGLLARATYRGRLADLEQADQIANEDPADVADALLLRAKTAMALHRFPEVSPLLDRVDALDPRGKTKAARLTLARAVGRGADALKLARELVAANPTAETLATLATLLVPTAPAEARALFARARAEGRDVSPFPPAWLDLQEGPALEKLGDRDGARRCYADAERLVPGYPAALAHLAALATFPDEAIALLEPLVQSSDDPEYEARLAAVLAIVRRGPEAAAHRMRVRERYELLLAKHPEAFADHAAWLFLSLGESERALAWAKRNYALRPTDEARELLTRASAAAGEASAR